MVPCPDMGNIKVKKAAGLYLLHRISGGDGILGPHPNLTGLNSFQRVGVDAVTLMRNLTPFGSPNLGLIKGGKPRTNAHGSKCLGFTNFEFQACSKALWKP